MLKKRLIHRFKIRHKLFASCMKQTYMKKLKKYLIYMITRKIYEHY